MGIWSSRCMRVEIAMMEVGILYTLIQAPGVHLVQNMAMVHNLYCYVENTTQV